MEGEKEARPKVISINAFRIVNITERGTNYSDESCICLILSCPCGIFHSFSGRLFGYKFNTVWVLTKKSPADLYNAIHHLQYIAVVAYYDDDIDDDVDDCDDDGDDCDDDGDDDYYYYYYDYYYDLYDDDDNDDDDGDDDDDADYY